MTPNLRRPACDCIDELNRDMVASNTMLVTTLFTGGALVATQKIDASCAPGPIVAPAAFCPFCGLPYVRGGAGAGSEIAALRARAEQAGETRLAG